MSRDATIAKGAGDLPNAELVAQFDAIVAGHPVVDRHEVFAQLRDALPVFFSEATGAWVVSRYDDVRGVLQDASAFVPITEGPGASVFGGGFFHWRGREHNKKAGIVGRRLRSARAVREELAGKVEEIARRLAAELPLEQPVDLRERYAMWVPLLVISELTGIEEATRLRGWYDTIMAGGTSSIGNPGARAAALQAMQELKEFLVPLLAERRVNPGSDLVSDLVAARYDGAPLPDDEIVSIVGQLLPAGVETTERVLTSAFRLLCADRPLWDQLCEVRDSDDALASFGAEALRCYPPIQAANRVALADTVVAGQQVAAGEKVVALLASANRDPSRFADPDRFDAERFSVNPDRQYTSTGEVLPFGAGEHHCTGSRLAKVEIVETVRALLDRASSIDQLGDAPDVGGLVLWSPAALEVRIHGRS
jgi:pulcherriminic acid synthase